MRNAASAKPDDNKRAEFALLGFTLVHSMVAGPTSEALSMLAVDPIVTTTTSSVDCMENFVYA